MGSKYYDDASLRGESINEIPSARVRVYVWMLVLAGVWEGFSSSVYMGEAGLELYTEA